MPRITPLCLPHLWIALPVHQVARLGSGHEAMSAREQLEEALKDVPEVINGFWYTADEFKALGFSDTLIAAMKDTTNYRGVNALIQGPKRKERTHIRFTAEPLARRGNRNSWVLR
jgi:hypothetical protein